MTVLVGLIHPTDGVAIFADRASIHIGTDIGHGVPAPADPRVKVRTNGDGLIAGVAGVAENGGVSVFGFVEQTLARTTGVTDAAGMVLDLLSGSKHALLGGVAPTGRADELPVVVLVGGNDEHGPRLRLVGLSWDGGVVSFPLDSSKAFAPPAERAHADDLIKAAAVVGHPMHRQIRDLGNALPTMAAAAIVKDAIDISFEYDYALTDRPGHSHVVAVEPPPVKLNIPRHG